MHEDKIKFSGKPEKWADNMILGWIDIYIKLIVMIR